MQKDSITAPTPDGVKSSSKSIFDKEPSMVRTQEPLLVSTASDDPFNFFQAAVPKGKTREEKVENTNEDDDDFFDFESAETPKFIAFISHEGPSSALSVHTSHNAAGLERNSALDV